VLSAGSWAVWLLDATGSTLTCWRASAPVSEGLEGYQVSVNRGVVGLSVREGRMIYSPDLVNDRRYDRVIGAQAEVAPACLVCSPLITTSPAAGTAITIGAVSVAGDTVDAFGAADLAVISAITASAATALHNARLYDQAQSEIDRRLQVEQALRQSESHHRTLVETSPDAILLLSRDGKVLMCNRRTAELFGYRHSADLLGTSAFNLLSPEAQDAAAAGYAAIVQGEAVRDQEVWMQRTDGSSFIGELSAVQTADTLGRPEGVVLLVRDVTARREAREAARRHSQELEVLNDLAERIGQSYDLQDLLESALDVALETLSSDTGRILLFSRDHGSHGGIELEAHRGQCVDPVARDRKRDSLKAPLSRVCGGREARRLDAAALVELGAVPPIACEVACMPLVLQDRLMGAVMIAGVRESVPHEIPDRQLRLLAAIGRQLSVAVDRARLARDAADADMLRRLDQLRSELIASFSHDLRSPLGVILMTCSTLLREDIELDAATQREFLSDITDQVDHLTRLVDGILDLGRMEAGELRLDRIALDLRTLLTRQHSEAQTRFPNHRIGLDVPVHPVMVLADSPRLDQVLHNLLDNAAKYSPAGGSIDIALHRGDHRALVTISDTGIGIAPSQLDLIFERFYRVRTDETHRISGTGLGLTTCRGIVEAHGGNIWADSDGNHGSTFSFTLPLAPGLNED